MALAHGDRAARYQAGLDVTDRERSEAAAYELARRVRDAITFHQRRDAMAERRARFLAEAGGATAEVAAPAEPRATPRTRR